MTVSQTSHDQIVSGDWGVPIEIDTELDDLSGLTLEIEFYDPTGTYVTKRTASDGGDGPIGKIVKYTTIETDSTGTDHIHVAVGRWAHIPRLTAVGQKLRHGSPPVYATVVKKGT